MARPRLTSAVLDGLKVMRAVAESGACEDFLGNDETEPSTATDWAAVQRACKWIDAVEAHLHAQLKELKDG